MKVSEIPFENLMVGDRCISALGTHGVISKLGPYDREDNLVYFEWESGNKSCVWHFWCEAVEYIGRSNEMYNLPKGNDCG